MTYINVVLSYPAMFMSPDVATASAATVYSRGTKSDGNLIVSGGKIGVKLCNTMEIERGTYAFFWGGGHYFPPI